MRVPCLPIFLAFVAGAVAQAAPAPISLDTLKAVTPQLASDEFEGRAPGTPGEAKTTAYLIERMKAAGLQPGNHGQWTQPVPIVKLAFRDMTPMRISGGAAPLTLAPKDDFIIGTYRVVPRIELHESDMVFVGYGVTAPERGWDDYAGIDARGKTVIVLINDPDWETPTLEGPFGGRAMTYYGRWTYKFEEAARRGATAVLIVHATEPAAYGWSVVPTVITGLGLDRGEKPAAFQSDVIGWIQKSTAGRLFAAAGKDFAALSAAAAKPGFRAVPLGLKASVSFDNGIERTVSSNVVGILPGKGAPDEYVLYSAHWDHFGRCAPVAGDDICNGALDNATGSAGLVALAEAFGKAGATRRSQVFLGFTAEEYGLLGSQYYAENPVFPLARTVGGVNMDVLNIYGAARDFAVSGAGKSQLEDIVKPLVVAQGRTVVAEPQPEKGYYYRSDHFPLAKLGVPMLYAKSGEDLVKGGPAAGKAAADDYVANRYHKPQDEYRTDWDWSGALQDLTIYYQLGRELANGDAWPNWYPADEFRKVRDASRAASRGAARRASGVRSR